MTVQPTGSTHESRARKRNGPKPIERLRQGLSLAVVSVLLGGALAGCGGDTATATPATSAPPPAAATDTTAPAAAATNTSAPMAAATDTTAPAAAATNTSAPAAATAAGTAAPAPTATPYPTVPAPPGAVKLTFWYGLTGFNGGVVQQVINKFNTSQTKYYVEGIQQPNYDDTINKLNTSLAGGSLPSLVQVYDIGTQRMIDSKRIIPVQDFVEKDNQQALVKDLEPAVASYYTVNGKLYSMPFNSSAPVLYYDKNAFKEVGLDPDKPPQTYDEVFAAAQKLVKKDANGKIIRSGIDFT